MKNKRVYLIVISVLAIFVLELASVSAGWFDDFLGNNIIGRVVDTTTSTSREYVTCVFKDSTSQQLCYSDSDRCSGIGECKVRTAGRKGEKISWTSSCSGKRIILMDGKDENATFDCNRIMNEKVSCSFKNSITIQSCYSSKGDTCKGMEECIIKIEGVEGNALNWRSTCSGEKATKINGIDKTVEFDCMPRNSKKAICVDNEYRLAKSCLKEGHYFGVESCIDGNWIREQPCKT